MCKTCSPRKWSYLWNRWDYKLRIFCGWSQDSNLKSLFSEGYCQMMQSVSADVGKSAKIGRNPPELLSFYIFFGGYLVGKTLLCFVICKYYVDVLLYMDMFIARIHYSILYFGGQTYKIYYSVTSLYQFRAWTKFCSERLGQWFILPCP